MGVLLEPGTFYAVPVEFTHVLGFKEFVPILEELGVFRVVD